MPFLENLNMERRAGGRLNWCGWHRASESSTEEGGRCENEWGLRDEAHRTSEGE